MLRKVFLKLVFVAAFFGFGSPLWAGDQTFPVGLWLSDVIGSQYGFKPEYLAALRWQGMNVGTAGGEIGACKTKLARYDSSAYRIWLAANPFHFSIEPNQYLDIAGHDPFAPLDREYFISYSYSNPNRNPAQDRTKAQFDSYLNGVVASVVDSVKSAHAMWRYFYWDEPNNDHYSWYQDPNKKYWQNIWWGDDQTCSRSDSLGIHSWLKWKIEHRDSLHSVCINLGGAYRNNAGRSMCNAKYRNVQGQISSNKMKSLAFDDWPFLWWASIGDTSRLRAACTIPSDSLTNIGKQANPSDPAKVYITQLQHCGWPRVPSDTINDCRIPIPEEVREFANLSILHEIKGIFYFVLPTEPDRWAQFWDEQFVPFDAPYEEYVYNRSSSLYYPPDSLRPFWDSTHPIHDPFRSPGNRPDTTGPRRWENYYLWKYAPYARNWNFMRSINDPLHIIAPHLPDLWKVGQRITSVVADGGVPTYVEYVTFADSVQGHNPTAFYAFIVNKDFNSTQRGFTVTVNGSQLPQPPIGQRYYVLDLNSRHLIPSTGNIVFHTVLKPGEGRLFRFIIGPLPTGEGGTLAALPVVPNPYNGSKWSTLLVTDPDISFYKSGQQPGEVQFTEGDTVVLQAVIYNLGFANKSDSVKFYRGDPLAGGTYLGGSYVTVPALSIYDTLPKSVTVTVNWITNGSTALGPHDINVILKGATSSAHQLLWLNAEDYATKVNNNPWDMTEDPLYPDISSYAGFTALTDSISGAWEGETFTDITPYPELHFRITSPIDASKYKLFKCRIYSNQNDSCTVRWYPQQPGGVPGMVNLPGNTWTEVTIDLGGLLGWGGSVTDFYLKFASMDGRKIRLAWAKLTTR